MANIFDITNRNVVVTGGMGFLGRTIVEYFAAEKANIVFSDIVDNRDSDEFQRGLPANSKCRYIKCDLKDSDQVKRMIDESAKFLGSINSLVNTAAFAELAFAEEMTDAQWDETIKVSLFGSYYSCRSAFDYLKEQGGSIVNVASIAGLIGLPRGTTHHSAAKAGMLGMTRSLALEWAKYNIRVNGIAPGQFDTGPLRKVMQNKTNAADILRCIPMGRVGTTMEVAAAVHFLISDASSFITGHTLVIDGGTTIS